MKVFKQKQFAKDVGEIIQGRDNQLEFQVSLQSCDHINDYY